MFDHFQIEAGKTDVFFLRSHNFQASHAQIGKDAGTGTGGAPVRVVLQSLVIFDAIILHLIGMYQFNQGLIVFVSADDHQHATTGFGYFFQGFAHRETAIAAFGKNRSSIRFRACTRTNTGSSLEISPITNAICTLSSLRS